MPIDNKVYKEGYFEKTMKQKEKIELLNKIENQIKAVINAYIKLPVRDVKEDLINPFKKIFDDERASEGK